MPVNVFKRIGTIVLIGLWLLVEWGRPRVR
jgi:hypothetical protein